MEREDDIIQRFRTIFRKDTSSVSAAVVTSVVSVASVVVAEILFLLVTQFNVQYNTGQ